jgi:hypothetical protein
LSKCHYMAGPRDTLSGTIESDGHLTKPTECKDPKEATAKSVQSPWPRSEAIPDPIALRRPAFLANRWLDLAKMRDALASSDFATVQTIGHNCKGIGVGYGFPDISSAGSAIEAAAKVLNADEVEESLREFERSMLAASAGALQASSLLYLKMIRDTSVLVFPDVFGLRDLFVLIVVAAESRAPRGFHVRLANAVRTDGESGKQLFQIVTLAGRARDDG